MLRYQIPIALGTSLLINSKFKIKDQNIYCLSETQSYQRDDDLVTEKVTGVRLPGSLLCHGSTTRQSNHSMFKIKLALKALGVRQLTIFKFNTYVMGLYMPDSNKGGAVREYALRLIPSRATNGSHLRNAFVKMLNQRLQDDIKSGDIDEDLAGDCKQAIDQLCQGAFPASKQIPTNSHITIHASNINSEKQCNVKVYFGLNADQNLNEQLLTFELHSSPSAQWLTNTLLKAYIGDNPLIPSLAEQYKFNSTDNK
ncbi:hypothetical protein MIR68_009307 [Amoeboaphelidium protococcarum]|nr:hypothetical protein MIR68_009307 [Amoeboaphelidium protococcarum]